MKNVFKILVGSIVIVAALAACGKKGGGGSTATTGFGYYNGYSNVSGYAGEGQWSGTLNITNPAMLNQMYQETGRCGFGGGYGYGPRPLVFPGYVQPGIVAPNQFTCVQATFLQISFSIPATKAQGQIVSPAGVLPGRGYFQIVPVLNGQQRRQQLISKYTDARMNASNNGFVLTYTPNQVNAVPFLVPGQTQIAQAGILNIATVWRDASKTILDVTVIYKDQIVAQGQVYNPQAGGIGPNGGW